MAANLMAALETCFAGHPSIGLAGDTPRGQGYTKTWI